MDLALSRESLQSFVRNATGRCYKHGYRYACPRRPFYKEEKDILTRQVQPFRQVEVTQCPCGP